MAKNKNSLIEELHQAAANYRSSLRRVGDVLLALEKQGHEIGVLIDTVLRDVIPVLREIKRQPEFRGARATSVRMDDHGHIVFVSSGREPIYMRVDASLIEEARRLLDIEVAA